VLRSENRAIFVQVKERNADDIGLIVEYSQRRGGRKGPVIVERDFFNGLLGFDTSVKAALQFYSRAGKILARQSARLTGSAAQH
jgi:hypothetical protein